MDLRSLFAQPPAEYSPTPIWWWSGERLELPRLRWQLQQLAAGGVHNVVVLNLAPTGPLFGSDPDDPPFLSDEWWSLFEAVCEEAQRLGVRIYFYDQIGFSGANLQGEVVTVHPELRGRRLGRESVAGSGPLQVRCPAEGQPLAAVFIAESDDAAHRDVAVVDGVASIDTDLPGRLEIHYSVAHGYDYYSPQAAPRLLERIHDEFDRRVGRFFGTVIAGSFQDELPSMPTWSADFATEFERRRGYDLVGHLASLYHGDRDEDRRVRTDYHAVRAELAEERWFKPLFDWHDSRGLICGVDQQSPSRTGDVPAGVTQYADYMRTHRWYGAPGSDHQGEAKVHSSLAHLYGRPRVWIESFHSTGWGGTLEETYDWLVPWLRAGATLYNPHAVYYSTRGGWWEWASPSTCWRQPYWRHYPLFATAVSRLCALLSQGHHECDVAVLHATTAAQATLTPEGVGANVDSIREAYVALVGFMYWHKPRPGVLDGDRRDFDVIDDASLAAGTVRDGRLRVAGESFAALILPECSVMAAASLERACDLADAGGLVVVVGAPPDLAVGDGDTDGVVARFRALVGRGTVVVVDSADAVPAALAGLPRTVEAPVPTLRRRAGGATIVLVPGAFPYATAHAPDSEFGQVDYTFDPSTYVRPMDVVVRGVTGNPQLWDPATGATRVLTATTASDGVAVTIPADAGPAAVLVWDDADADTPVADAAVEPVVVATLDTRWTAEVQPTLDNRYGDIDRPAYAGAPPVQTWSFEHAVDDGSGSASPDRLTWRPVEATFGPYGWRTGPLAAAQLPAGGGDTADPSGDWRPAEYSLSRGIAHDGLHALVPTFGAKGHVPEEFLAFGTARAGEGVQFRTLVWSDRDEELVLAVGGAGAKTVWWNGELAGEDQPGYQWMAPVRVRPGYNRLEWRLVAEADTHDLRAYWALLRDADAFRRPEWLEPVDPPRRDSQVVFTHRFELDGEPGAAVLQVGSDGATTVVVNGEELGQQGAFDPYGGSMRIQPYNVTNLRPGENQLELRCTDPGHGVAAFVDATVRCGDRTVTIASDASFTVSRDGAPAQPVRLRRRQILGDPSWACLRRRPHPLPGARWLEDADDGGAVADRQPCAGVDDDTQWLRWRLPVGARRVTIPVAGDLDLWLGDVSVPVSDGTADLPHPDVWDRIAVARVRPRRGRRGGALLEGPLAYETGSGPIELGSWADAGLSSWSGGVVYRTTFSWPGDSATPVSIDLGRVRGTAEVTVNGRPCGARVWSPYRFDIGAAVQPGENTVEVLVLNTLAPRLRTASPTPFVYPRQEVSGLFGPVRLLGTAG